MGGGCDPAEHSRVGAISRIYHRIDMLCKVKSMFCDYHRHYAIFNFAIFLTYSFMWYQILHIVGFLIMYLLNSISKYITFQSCGIVNNPVSQ